MVDMIASLVFFGFFGFLIYATVMRRNQGEEKPINVPGEVPAEPVKERLIMPREQQMCYHPELYPTRWEEKRPEPCLMSMACQCGENQFCPICRFGFGALPCSCAKAHGTVQVKIN